MRGSTTRLSSAEAPWRGFRARVAERLGDAERVGRFLRERRAFAVRDGDVFISSYPRSGTTWLQHIAHVLVHDGDTQFRHIADVVPWFERSLALSERRALDFARMGSPRLFKSHLPYAWLPRGARYIYVVRDGRDVAVSYYHFYRSHLGFRADFPAFLRLFFGGQLQYRSWFKHVDGWLEQRDNPRVHFVTYEHLLEDLERVLHGLAAFLGVDRSRERIAQLEPLCRFDYMKRHERRFDHATITSYAAGSGTFIREGRRGAFAAWFSEPQLREFRERTLAAARWPALELHLAAFLH